MIHKEKELISEGFTTEYSRTCVMKAWKLTVNVGHANFDLHAYALGLSHECLIWHLTAKHQILAENLNWLC